MYSEYIGVVVNMGMDDKADTQYMANLHMSLFHDTMGPYYFPCVHIYSLLVVEEYNMDMMAEGDWVLEY